MTTERNATVSSTKLRPRTNTSTIGSQRLITSK